MNLDKIKIEYIKEPFGRLRDQLVKRRETTRLIRSDEGKTIMNLYAPEKISAPYSPDLDKGDTFTVSYKVTSNGKKRGMRARKV